MANRNGDTQEEEWASANQGKESGFSCTERNLKFTCSKQLWGAEMSSALCCMDFAFLCPSLFFHKYRVMFHVFFFCSSEIVKILLQMCLQRVEGKMNSFGCDSPSSACFRNDTLQGSRCSEGQGLAGPARIA